MATNLAIDDQLLEEALKIGGHKTKRATVTEALNEYIQRRKQQQILELFGTIDVDPAYDYKKQRHWPRQTTRKLPCASIVAVRKLQGSNTDFLMCAVSLRMDVSILTTDKDFPGFARVLGFALHDPR